MYILLFQNTLQLYFVEAYQGIITSQYIGGELPLTIWERITTIPRITINNSLADPLLDPFQKVANKIPTLLQQILKRLCLNKHSHLKFDIAC